MDPLTLSSPVGVAALAVRTDAVAATSGSGPLVERGAKAGAYVHDGPALTTGWHVHDFHQVEYPCFGTLGVETDHGGFVIGQHQVAWIPAGVRHISTLGEARTISVFLAPDLLPGAPSGRAIALAATPLLRELLHYSRRWPITRSGSDTVADAFFVTVGQLLSTWLEEQAPFALPTAGDPIVALAIKMTHENLAAITHKGLSRNLGVSERTLRRRFSADTGITWREYLVLARLLKALGLLAAGHETVLQVATNVGFESPAAFTRAFVRRTGETPTAYRRRVMHEETGTSA